MEYSKKRPFWFWLIVYLVIGGIVYAAVYFLFLAKTPTITTTTPIESSSSNQTVITITSAGFTPNAITIPTGGMVAWDNQSGVTVEINSSPHPTHTDYLPLNIGPVEDGARAELSFPTAGTYRYHNHLDASQFGSITVQ